MVNLQERLSLRSRSVLKKYVGWEIGGSDVFATTFTSHRTVACRNYNTVINCIHEKNISLRKNSIYFQLTKKQ